MPASAHTASSSQKISSAASGKTVNGGRQSPRFSKVSPHQAGVHPTTGGAKTLRGGGGRAKLADLPVQEDGTVVCPYCQLPWSQKAAVYHVPRCESRNCQANCVKMPHEPIVRLPAEEVAKRESSVEIDSAKTPPMSPNALTDQALERSEALLAELKALGLGLGEENETSLAAGELPPNLPERQASRDSMISLVKQTESMEVPFAVLDVFAETWCKYRQLQTALDPAEATDKKVPSKSYRVKDVKYRHQLEPEPETTPIEESAASESDPDSLSSTCASSSRGSLHLPGFKSNSSSQAESFAEQYFASDLLSNQDSCEASALQQILLPHHSKQSSVRRQSPIRRAPCGGHEPPQKQQIFSQPKNTESERYPMTCKSTMVHPSPRVLQRTVPEPRLRVLSPERTQRALSPPTVSRQVSCTHKQMQLPQLSPRTCNRDIPTGFGVTQVGTNATCVVQQTITITNTVHVHSSY